MWFSIVWFLSWVSGWRTLARHYAGELPAQFQPRKLRTVTLGRGRFPRAHYRSVLWAEFSDSQLILKPHILFRWAHPPLIIPRADVSARERSGLLRQFCEVSTLAEPGIGLHLPIRDFGWPEEISRGS